MGALKRIGKGAYSKVYEHPTKVGYVLILGRDLFKDMLVDNRFTLTEELQLHLPDIEYVGMLDCDTVYACKKYDRLTKKNYPKAWEDYASVQNCIVSLENARAETLAKLNYNHLQYNTALSALWELANIAYSYCAGAQLDHPKRNFMVDPSTAALVLNDLFFNPHN